MIHNLDNSTGWDDIPDECKAEYYRAMARHPAGGVGNVIPLPQRPAHATPAPRRDVLHEGSAIGTFVAVSTLIGLGVLLFGLWFGLVKP